MDPTPRVNKPWPKQRFRLCHLTRWGWRIGTSEFSLWLTPRRTGALQWCFGLPMGARESWPVLSPNQETIRWFGEPAAGMEARAIDTLGLAKPPYQAA